MPIQRALASALDGPCGVRPGETVLVGVSGGADSMALLHAVMRAARTRGLRVVAAHAHHGLRGADADRDAALVRTACAAWGVPCASARLRLEPRGSPEERARRARRRFLAAAAAAHEARVVLLGHHAGDQAETVLARVLAGAGPDGLRGMRLSAPLPEAAPRRVRLLRPWLGVDRSEILRYVARHAVPFREDGSNADPAFQRNRLRHQVLPGLRAAGYPAVKEALGRLGRLAGEAADLVESAAAHALAGLVRPLGDTLALLFAHPPRHLLVLDRPAFRALAAGLHAPVLRAAVRRLDPARPPIPGHRALADLVRRTLRPGGDAEPWQCRRGLWAVQDAAWLILSSAPLRLASPPFPPIRLDRDETRPLGNGALALALRTGTPAGRRAAGAAPPGDVRVLLDARRLALPLDVRPIGPDDTLETGAGGRRHRLVPWLKHRRVPALERRVTPVVFASASSRVVAVPGHFVAPWAAATAASEEVLDLRMHASDGRPS